MKEKTGIVCVKQIRRKGQVFVCVKNAMNKASARFSKNRTNSNYKPAKRQQRQQNTKTWLK